MTPRITLITLGVRDLPRSVRFYRDGLGWPTEGIEGADGAAGGVAFFELHGGLKLGLFGLASLAEDAGVPAGEPGPATVSLAHNVGSKAEVDAVIAEAERAGAIITQAPHDAFWGGYTAYFADPDGHLWEVAWNPFWPLPE